FRRNCDIDGQPALRSLCPGGHAGQSATQRWISTPCTGKRAVGGLVAGWKQPGDRAGCEWSKPARVSHREGAFRNLRLDQPSKSFKKRRFGGVLGPSAARR